tara:strand:+ start:1371 stop:1559 length:189 start_codon:yes stop_codon:yes gene_type:complete
MSEIEANFYKLLKKMNDKTIKNYNEVQPWENDIENGINKFFGNMFSSYEDKDNKCFNVKNRE